MPNQRAKNKTHFTASTETELMKAIEEYAKINNLDRNTALRVIAWEVSEREGIKKAPPEFWEEVDATKKKIAAKLQSAKKKNRKQ